MRPEVCNLTAPPAGEKREDFLFNGKLLGFLVGLEELPQERRQERQRYDQAKRVGASGKEIAELPHDQRDHIGEAEVERSQAMAIRTFEILRLA